MTSAGAPVRDPGAPASRPASATTPGLLGAAALTGFILILPSPEGLPPEAHRLAALFAGVLVLWSTEALPIAVTALLALALQPIFGLTSLVTGRPPTPGAIFGAAAANFMSSVFFFVLVMFAIAHAWVKTGLARRFALWLIARAGTDATRAVYVFMIGTGAISMVVSDVPAAAIFMAIAVGILDKLGLRPGSRFGRAVMIGIPIAALIGGVGTPAGSSINLLGLVMIEQAGGDRVPFLHWMAIGIPMVAILLPVAAWVLLKFFPPEIASIGDLEEIHDERRRMGPVSRAEWKVVAIMSAMITLWIASTWLPVFDTFLVAVVGAVAMFLPGIGLFTWKEVQQVTGWDTLMVIGGVTSLGQASSQTGLATWLAESALGGLADWNAVALIAAISAFTVVIHLMLPIAPVINAVMIPPIMVLGAAAGVNPALYALPVIFTASCAFLLPLDAVPLVTYSRGYYRMFDMVGQLAVFLLGRLFAFPDGSHQVIGGFLCVRRRLVDFLRIVFQRLDPAGDARRAAAAVVADADALAGHHRRHFGAEFFAGVLGAAEMPDAVLERVAVHPRGVAGGVTEFVQRGLVVPVRGGKLLTFRERHLVGLHVVERAIAAFVAHGDAALLDDALGGLMRFPLGLVVPVLVAPLQLQAVRLFDVEHGVTADHRRAGALALGRPVWRRGRLVDRAGLLLLPLVVKLVKEHMTGLLALRTCPPMSLICL